MRESTSGARDTGNFGLVPDITLDVSATTTLDVMGAPGDTYPTLVDSEQEKLEETLVSLYDDAESVLDRIRNWKYGSGDYQAIRHEKVFKEELGINAPLRKPTNWNPSGEEKNTARILHDLSTEIIARTLGSSFTLYRGLSFEHPYLLRDVLESDSDQTDYTPQPSVLSNYTHSEKGAAYFCPLVVEKEQVEPSHVALAANYLFKYSDSRDKDYTDSNGIVSPNGELRIRGDREHPLREDELIVLIGDTEIPRQPTEKPLVDFIEQCPDFVDEEHEVMRGFVEEMAGREISISDPDARIQLQEWAEAYEDDMETSAQKYVNRII